MDCCQPFSVYEHLLYGYSFSEKASHALACALFILQEQSGYPEMTPEWIKKSLKYLYPVRQGRLFVYNLIIRDNVAYSNDERFGSVLYTNDNYIIILCDEPLK